MVKHLFTSVKSTYVEVLARYFAHKRAVRRITKYLASTSTYVDLTDVNRWLTTRGVVYSPDIEKGIKCYVDSEVLVDGLKQILIMQKMSCHKWDM